MKKICLALLFCLLLLSATGLAAEPNVRVGLAVRCFSAIVGCKGGITVSGNKNLRLKSGDHTIATKGGVFTIDGNSVGKGPLSLRPLNKQCLTVNKKAYRGTVSVYLEAKGNTMTVVNILPLEQYLYGVIPKEIIPLWPEEAVKAQTVASRSYVLYNANARRSSLYDVRANQMGQAYGGVSAEHKRTNKIIDATRGMVALWAGKPINAVFFSCSGGYTESSESVWGRGIPYLQAVRDYDREAPQYTWHKEFKPAQVEAALTRAGYGVGKIESIRLSVLGEPPVREIDRGISGRVKQLTIRGRARSVTLPGTKLRSILQLPSTLFDITVGLKRPEYIDVPILNRAGMEIGRKKIPITPRKKDGTKKTGNNVRYVTNIAGEELFFRGGGSGHGVGMSQWGARGMAIGQECAASKYDAILRHYYQGITLQKLY